MKYPLYPSLLITTALLLGCSGGNSTDPDPVDGAGSYSYVSLAYTVSGSRIITPAYVDTSYFCVGSELESDTVMIASDTVTFSVSGNTLTLITDTDTTGSGAIVEWISELTRSGSGTGLKGTWKDGELSYRVVSGELTQDEKDELDAEMEVDPRLDGVFISSVTFTENTLTTTVDILTAEFFAYQWNGSGSGNFEGAVPDSAQYDITVKVLDKYTVELKGNETGETVRIKILPNGDRTYTSSEAGHAESRYVQDSKTCPNVYEPLWYVTFKEDNSVESGVLPAAKSGKNGKKSRQAPHFPFFPLNPGSTFLN